MTQISRAEALRRQEPTGYRLGKLERLNVTLEVAYSMQKQKGFENVILKGANMEADVLHSLIDICDTDPAHILNADTFWTEAEAQHNDWLDEHNTIESVRP